MIIVASVLLLPSTFIIYGVASVIFAAKEAVERRAMEKGRQEGRHQGQKTERERIERELEESGAPVPPEIARIIAGESGPALMTKLSLAARQQAAPTLVQEGRSQ